MKIKEWLIWQKMLYNRGGAWLSDALLGGLFAIFLYTQNILYIAILLLTRWFIGYIDYRLKLIHIESELAIRKQNPYLDMKLNGMKKNDLPKMRRRCGKPRKSPKTQDRM